MLRLFELFCLCCSVVVAAAKDKAFVIVVDPAWDDTKSYIWHSPWVKDFKMIKVNLNLGNSFSYMKHHGGKDYPEVDFFKEFTYNSVTPDAAAAADILCPQLQGLDLSIEAIIPSSDPTVHLCDLLAVCTGARGGGPSTGPLAEARRDKWVMGESVRKAGLRSVLQKKVSTWDEAKAFLETWEPPLSPERPCIFKILEGVAGNGVYKVTNFEQGKEDFAMILSTQSDPASFNLMVQEYLEGKEYAVDSVSRNGVHKVVAVWFEDFRPANGIFDQYFGFVLMDPEDPLTKTIVEYGNKVLDALGLHNGAANTEIKFLPTEQQPCLVEVNARWAGVNFHDALAVEDACTGNNQFNACFQAYLDEDAFNKMPAVRPIKAHGAAWMAVNYKAGKLVAVPGMDLAMKLKSFYNWDLQVQVGQPLAKTTPSGIPASVALVNKDNAVVTADYNYLIDLSYTNRFFDTANSDTFLAENGHPASSTWWMDLAFAGACVGVVLLIITRQGKNEGVDQDTTYVTME